MRKLCSKLGLVLSCSPPSFEVKLFQAITLLENLMSKLELKESRAQCVYEQMVRVAKEVTALEGAAYVEQRRVRAVALVGKIKQLLTVHWDNLDEHQKSIVSVYSYTLFIFLSLAMLCYAKEF